METGAHTCTYVDPGVVHKLRDGHSLVRVCLQELVDQVFGLKKEQDNVRKMTFTETDAEALKPKLKLTIGRPASGKC